MNLRRVHRVDGFLLALSQPAALGRAIFRHHALLRGIIADQTREQVAEEDSQHHPKQDYPLY